MIRLRAAALGLPLALACLAGPARADEARGLALLREARDALARGEAERAIELAEAARVEWPGSALAANVMGDALAAASRYAEALAEYERGLRDGLEPRARFNGAVARHRLAESWLSEAGVPLDPAGLAEGPQPAQLAAIERALPELGAAAEGFLSALDGLPHERAEAAAARESLAALNRRADRLHDMAEELRSRQEPDQPQDGDEQDEQQQGEQDGEPGQPGEPPQEPGDESRPQDPAQEQPPSQDPPQDQPQPGDPPQPQDGEGEAEGSEQKPDVPPGDEPPSEPASGERDGAPSSPPRELSPAELQQLLDKLEALEQQARALQKAREAARRRAVEKDW